MIARSDRPISKRSPLGWICPIALFATYAILAGRGLARDSMTFDELAHLTGGASSWIEKDHRMFQQNGQFPKRWGTLPLLVSDVRYASTAHQDWWHSDVDRFGHRFLYESGNDLDSILLRCRAMMIVVGLLAGALAFYWSNYLFGRIGGCITLALCAFSPALLAHGRIVTSDATASLTFVLALLYLWEVAHTISVVRVLCSAVAVGLLLTSKFSGLVIVPIAAILTAVRLAAGLPLHIVLPRHNCVVRRPLQKVAYLSAVTLVVSAGAGAIIWAFYDFRYSALREHVEGRDRFFFDESIDSLTAGHAGGRAIRLARDFRMLPESYLFGLSHVLSHSSAHPSFMNGKYSPFGWTLYFPYAVMVKTPLPVFAIAALAIGAVAPTIRRCCQSGRRIGIGLRRIVLVMYRTTPLWTFLLVYWSVALRIHLSIGERHVLPTYPAVFILCGAAGRWVQTRHRLGTVLLLAAVGCLVIESVRIGPHYLSYFNSLAGGPENGYRRLVDSSFDWGQDLSRLRQWLEKKQRTNVGYIPVYVAYFGSADPAFSGIQATLLPGYLDWRDEIDLQKLRPGVYCISATMLQSVYGPAFGRWNDEYESLYRRYSKLVSQFDETRVPLIRADERRYNERQRIIYEFEQLRFARLCEYLRRREPDDRVAYSILIYYVTDEELAAATGQE